MILYAIGLHVMWGVIGLSDRTAYDSTALSAIFRLFGTVTPLACFAVAIFAFGAMFCRRPTIMVGLMLPQQTLLIISALGAGRAVWSSSFADGVIRSQAFILSDQAPALLAAFVHTFAIFLCVLRLVDGEL
jgi:hypothetical protein